MIIYFESLIRAQSVCCIANKLKYMEKNKHDYFNNDLVDDLAEDSHFVFVLVGVYEISVPEMGARLACQAR